MQRFYSATALCLAIFAAGSLISSPLWAHSDHPPATAEVDATSVKVTGACARYLGNEGVLIHSGASKILFDAFYNDSYGQYTLVPEQDRAALMAGSAPYDGIDALFVSHVHGDHFSAAPTLAYLQAHPEVDFYASQQVVDALIAAGAEVKDNWHAFKLAVGDPAQGLSVGNLTVDVVRIPHAGWPERAEVENLAFRVAIKGGPTVLHLGDADPNSGHFRPHQAHWDAKTLHLAMPPYWFYPSEDGRGILSSRLKARRSIGIHVPEAATGKGDEWRYEYQADLFTDPGEIRVLAPGTCAETDVGVGQ